jgi:hypothetical protein
METDIGRTLAVVSQTPNLWAALADYLDKDYVFVRHLSVDADDILNISPWPWGIVSDLEFVPKPVITLSKNRPILFYWLNNHPADLPSHTNFYDSSEWTKLIEDIQTVLHKEVGGLKLAETRGLKASKKFIRSAELEGLFSSYPNSLTIPAKATIQASQTLKSHKLQWKVKRRNGESVLCPINKENSK